MGKNKNAILVMLLLTGLVGCKHKPNAAPPPQAQAPATTPENQPAQPATEPTTPPAETAPAKEPETPPSTATPATTEKPATPKPRPKHPAASHKATPNTQPGQKPANSVAQPGTTQAQAPAQQANNRPQSVPATGTGTPPAGGSAPETVTPSPAPAIPDEQTLHARGTTDQLLQATESNLRRLNRSLNAAEQKMVDEVKNYMQRARSAQTDGDMNLARNYALKAHQLSDALLAQ